MHGGHGSVRVRDSMVVHVGCGKVLCKQILEANKYTAILTSLQPRVSYQSFTMHAISNLFG
jgi:hypothetical protein